MEAFKDVLASIVGSAACVYTGQPFDTVKVRLQVQPDVFKGPIDCVKKTMAEGSIRSLWAGAIPALIGALSENTVAFAVNGALTRYVVDQPSNLDKKVSIFQPFLLGGMTGSCSAFVLCPCDVVKCRSQMNKSIGLGSSEFRVVLKDTLKKRGFTGLYTGISAQIMRDIPFYASFFGTYELFCKYLKDNSNLSDNQVYFVSGGFAGQISWLVSIVPDTVKSTMQTSVTPPKSFNHTLQHIIKTRGYGGLFAGVEVAIIRAFPANAALFLGYEMTRLGLDRYM